MLKTILKILYVLIPILIVLIFFVDLLSYYSNITINMISYLREFIILGIIFLCYHLIKQKLHFDELTVEQNLVRLTILIAANFVITLALNILFDPKYSGNFPTIYKSTSAIIDSTVMAFTAAMTLVPAIFILKQLIFYKRKRKTALFFNLFLLSITINAVSVFLTRQPTGWFKFSSETLANDITLVAAIFFIAVLSFRNEWITYLSRKKKLIYFFTGIPLYFGIASLFDLSYRTPLPAYSLSIAGLSYAMWLFLVIYGALAMVKLLFHLPTARAFDRKIKELNSLYDLGRMLNSETKVEKLLPLITKLTAQVLESNSTWLGQFDQSTKEFRITSHQNLSEEEIIGLPLTKMEGLNSAIVSRKGAILINDMSHNRPYRNLLQWKSDARSILGAPLFSNRNQLMGIIYATKAKEYTFDIDDVSLLEGFANQAAIALENANLLRESIERERLEQELKVARDVQIKLLPQIVPQIPSFDVDAFCLTAYEVGGDYYDFFVYSDGKPGIVIGDVSGKGTSAALYMAEFKGVIQTLAHSHESPYSLACAANSAIYPNIERRSFVSAIIAKVDPDRRLLSLARAGHPPVLYCKGNGEGLQNIRSNGIGIGLDSGEKFNDLLEEITLPMDARSSVIFYTDGMTEARNELGEEFGEERMHEIIKNCDTKTAEELKENLFNSVINFCGNTPLHDDLTIVVLKNSDNQPISG